MANAISAASFLGALGVNTHIDFDAYGYQNLANAESDINYLGVKIIRDSAETASDAQTWLQIAQATGAKFDDYVAETSPIGMQTDLTYVQQLAEAGILASIEGGNEEDDAYPASLNNTLAITAQFQQQVYALGQQLGLPVINMSFGAGWTAANNWQGDYGTVGDLSAYATYANAHSYANPGQLPDNTIQRINGLANLAASTRPVITTEIGWSISQFDQQTIAKYVLDAAMDGIKDGDAGMYFYGLYDDASGAWGLFNADGTPRPAASALHDLTTLLADPAAAFVPGALSYSLSNTQTGDNSALIEKSDGSFWLALWNETEAANIPHTITVNLATEAATVVEYDPLTGTTSIASWSNTSSIQVSVPDHPVLLEIKPGNGSPTPPSSDLPAPTGPVITVPVGETTSAGSTLAIAGVSVADSLVPDSPGSMTLNVSATVGLVAMSAGGNQLAGSGTHAMSVSGTLAQINADLATLAVSENGAAANDVVTIDVWDQAGQEGTKSFDVGVSGSAPTVATPPSPSGPLVVVPASQSVTVGSTVNISSASVVDAFAASNPGTLVLNISSSDGVIAMTNAKGAKIAGSGTHQMSVTGTLAQINADLSHLSYTAGKTAAPGSISFDVWDQAGLEGGATTSVAVLAAQAANLVAAPTKTVAASDANPIITVSATAIKASSGDHAFFIGGTNDILTAIGGTESVMAFNGKNAITTGAGNDTIRIAGSGSVVDAGVGTNEIYDSGSNNQIVLPQAGHGFDNIFGYVLQNNDLLDLRPLLAGTQWNGTQALIGDYVNVTSSNDTDAVIKIDPSGKYGGTSYSVATLHDAGNVTLPVLLKNLIL